MNTTKVKNNEEITIKESGKKNKKKKRNIWNGITAGISGIALLLSVITICQTNINHTMDYKPELRITASPYGMTWDENGEALSEEETVYKEVDKYVYDTPVDSYPMISIINIASKPAKDIVVTWNNEENIAILSEELQKRNSGTTVYLEDGLFAVQKEHENTSYIKSNSIQEINYLSKDLPDGKGYISLPGVYYDLIKDIARTNIDYKWNLSLKLTCSCKDSMNNQYDYEIELQFSPNFCYGYDKDIIDGKNGCVLEMKAVIKEL